MASLYFLNLPVLFRYWIVKYVHCIFLLISYLQTQSVSNTRKTFLGYFLHGTVEAMFFLTISYHVRELDTENAVAIQFKTALS